MSEQTSVTNRLGDSLEDKTNRHFLIREEVSNRIKKANDDFTSGKYTEARSEAIHALEQTREIGESDLESECLDLLGSIHYELGDLDQAYICHKRALFICQELTNLSGEAHNLWHLGRITRLQGRSQEALHHLESSLQLYLSLDEPLGQADAYNELGNLIWDYRRRRDYYEHALNIANIYSDTYRQSRANNNLAVTYWELGLYSQALSYIQAAVQLGRDNNNQESLCYMLETLGRVHLGLGQYDVAEQTFLEGKELTQRLQKIGIESMYWLGLGRVMLAREMPEKAIELIRKAVEMQEDKSFLGFLHTSLAWLGAAYLATKNYVKAERVSLQAVEQLIATGAGEFPPQEVWWLRYQVLISQDQDDLRKDKAYHALHRAYTVMMDNIADLSDEGLRRNYLNKVDTNRNIVAAWRNNVTHLGDITTLKQVDQATKPLVDESELLRNKLQRMLVITRRMNETHDVRSLLELIMNHVIELTGAGRGLLTLYDKMQKKVDEVMHGFDSVSLSEPRDQIADGIIEYVIKSKKPLFIENTADAFTQVDFNVEFESNHQMQALSVLCVPLISGPDLLGVLYVDTYNINSFFTKADLDFITVFANQAVTAIGNASLYEQVITTNSELELLTHTLEERVRIRTAELETANSRLSYRAMILWTIRQVAQQITSILDLDELLVQVVNLIREQFGYYFVGVWLLTPDQTSTVLRAGTGTVGRALMDKSMSIPLTTPSLITTVCTSGKSRIIEHVREVPDFLEVQELPNIVSEIVLPMYMGGELLGVLDISSDKATLFKEVDQTLLQTLANQIAVAIRNARLYQAEITRRRLAENLEYAGRILTSSLDLHDVPGRVLDLLNTLVPYDRGMILLQHNSTLRPWDMRGFPPGTKLEDIEISVTNDDIYQQLYDRRSPLIIGDTTQYVGWKQLDWLPVHRSWMGVAIIVEGQIVGMLSMTRRAANAFTNEDSTWVQAFTPQAAIAIQNASLYSKILSLNEDLEKRVEERTLELNDANRQLQQMDTTKSNFIKLAAHELRTPLTVIKGYSQMLKMFLDEQNAFALEGIENGTKRLTEIINSMLDMAKIDTQTLDMAKQPTRLREVIEKVKREFHYAMEQRRIKFESVGFGNLPVVQADPEMLTKVIHNLVVNAIKFTPDKGKVTIKGRTTSHNDHNYIEISIIDTGIGIAKEDQEYIFDKFHNIGHLETHSSGRTEFKAGGPGLGLSIARGIILAHNGKIWVESDGYDEVKCPGSRFYILLPLEQS